MLMEISPHKWNRLIHLEEVTGETRQARPTPFLIMKEETASAGM